MSFCLPPEKAKKFIEALKNDKINPEELANMSSAKRHEFFSELVGKENAKNVNSLFESKLLLKNQKAGLVSWAEKLTGLKPEVKKDIISKIQKMDKVLDAESADAFLEDLASTKLGTNVSFEEAQKIMDMSKKVTETKAKADPKTGEFPSLEDRMDYGRSFVDLKGYVDELKFANADTLVSKIKKNPVRGAGTAIVEAGGLTKSIKATLDNSVIGRQGLKTMFTNPKIWLKNSAQTFADMWNTYRGKDVMRDVQAEVLSRPNAINGLYGKEKLAIGVTEEAFPTSLPAKVPVLGKIFKASENAFTGFQYRTRADVFDAYVKIAEKTGADIEGIGKVANALTGRGNLGAAEPLAKAANNIFFSPRFLKSNIDLLTVHAADKGIGTFARKQAAYNLAKVVGGIASVLVIANTVAPDSVDFDPRSANFGKIKIGNTRFDVSGGMGSLLTLGARLATQKTKSSITNKITDFQVGKGLLDFSENKLSPLAGEFQDLYEGKDFNGNDSRTAGAAAKNLLLPIPVQTAQETYQDPKAANLMLTMILDGLGFGANTYGAPKKKKK